MQIKEIRDISGSHIKILPPDELPPCALSNDRVVQCALFAAYMFILTIFTVCSLLCGSRIPSWLWRTLPCYHL